MKYLPYVMTTLFMVALTGCSSSSNSPTADAENEGIDNADTPSGETPTDSSPDAPVDAIPDTDSDSPAPPTELPTMEARYRVTFDAAWTAASHPVQFPAGNPHFSGLVGAVHNAQVIFWEPGQIATDGIEQMAETGGKSAFLAEILTAIDSGSTLAVIDGPGIGTGDGQASVEILVSSDYPEITLTTMLAPSPDWFVGLHNFSLFDGTDFIASTSVDAVLYDSGTDSGVSYTSSNNDTQPRDPIAATTSEPQDSSFVNGLPIAGRFIIERL